VNDGKIRIGYFSGSHSHNNDFNVIAPILAEIMSENNNVILMIAGFLNIGKYFGSLSDQIEYYDFVPMRKLPQLILRSDINIAPLEIDNPFCQAKSAIKFFEAGLLKVPTVATATEPFKSEITNGEDGLLANDNNDWKNHLMFLIQNEKERLLMGENAYNTTHQKHVIQNIEEPSELVEFIKSRLR